MTKTLTIPATIGRRVLVFAAGTAGGVPQINNKSVPFDGGIAYVHNMDHHGGVSMINVGYMDHNGEAQSQTSVRLYDRAQDTTDAHGKEWYAVWMEYQFNQALRAMEPKVSAGRPGDIELNKIEDNGQPVGPGQSS